MEADTNKTKAPHIPCPWRNYSQADLELGVPVTIAPARAESTIATLAVEDPVVVFPKGFLIDVTWTIRRSPDADAYEALNAALARTSQGRRAPPHDPAVPLVTVTHAGFSTSNHDVRPYFSDDEPPTADIALLQYSSSWVPYSQHSIARVRFWLWPVPTDEPVEVAVEWPAAHIGRATTTIDGGAILRAAPTAAANFDRKPNS